MPTTLFRTGITLTTSILIALGVQAEQVPIVNPGFETVSRVLSGGEQTSGIGGPDTLVATRSPFPFGTGIVDWSDPVTVPGWRTRTLPFGTNEEILAGVLRPRPIDGEPFITGLVGDHVLAIQASLVGQKTTALLQPNTTYTLDFLGGISQFDSEYFLGASLIAIDDSAPLPIEGQTGVTRLALGTFTPPTNNNQPDGLMRRYQFSYTSPEVLPAPLIGTHVGISVFGSDGFPRALYDEFNLTAIPISTAGDANADGRVDLLDLDILGQNWQQPLTGSEFGDFNDDGTVDLLDLDILGANWQGSSASFDQALANAGIRVPEPVGLSLLAAGALAIGLRRKH